MIRARHLLLACAAIVGATGMVAAQESLLPPGFDDKPAPAAPRSAARPAPAPASARPAPQASAPASSATSTPVVQPLPADTGAPVAAAAPERDPLAGIDPALIDQLVEKVRPKYDIPPDAQRSLARVGVLAEQDGGFPAVSSHYLNGAFVEGVIGQMRGPLVSRWGHILLRRALASRLDTPVGMNGADWAALRAQLLLRMGEADTARALVQEVDSGVFTRSLEDAAMAGFLATADPVGLCPITALTAAGRPGWDWELARAICTAFTGDGPPAMAQLDRALRRGTGQKIDILLAQKFAGAAANSRRAVTIEWKDVDALTPWRTGMSLATGLEPPEELRKKAGPAYAYLAARAPMLPLAARAEAADLAAGTGILSSAAMVDLYSQIAAIEDGDATWSPLAAQLRTAYVAPDESDRLAAIKGLWGDGADPAKSYSRLVLTAYAAARMVPNESLADDATGLISSMLTAGLDRNAMRWAPFVPAGSEGWGLLALASPNKLAAVGADTLDTFQSNDSSSGALRSRFLLAGLMGLGRIDAETARTFAGELKVDLGRQTRWTRAIDSAAESNNPALVALLAGYGMQGASWDKMTAVHLYHIVSALRRVGLDGEARMIAAEAVSRV
ncbi:hypothetical protein OLX02_11665 [Novosphingobium sp. KCTC 2891]|uniref:hypothetical protein n=1 Tax=Novosphingobium sp. KCTC 2891 TaxID=2989730 RepID=UPI0022233967|nr:hypothetical protein [Novosphingobium sp. KCTC 2891]MCW1383478.1 hypothetical protein [Novosphingobium sp. KCTC 2891]